MLIAGNPCGAEVFYVTGEFRGTQRIERADSASEALTWAEEFHYYGATEINVRDHLCTYDLAELKEIVRSLRG